MNDQDIENHPSHKAYCAGIEFAKKHKGHIDLIGDVKRYADNWDDSEAFMDGFYEESEND